MRLSRPAATLVALSLAIAGDAAERDCAATPLRDFLREGKDLYLGEGHGTNEAPAVVRCLVEFALKGRKEPLIVSLEQDPSARNLESDAWRGVDGRNSEAMWKLTRYLLEQEKAGRLELHMQISFPIPFEPDKTPPTLDFAAYDRNIGTSLHELAVRGQLIAYGGSMHSRKVRIPGMQPVYEPAGAYLGPEVIHVELAAAAGGTAWNCTAAGCGIHDVPPRTQFAGQPGSLLDGEPFGHDFVYRLPRVTASPPKMETESRP